jgi:hypothetical protein
MHVKNLCDLFSLNSNIFYSDTLSLLELQFLQVAVFSVWLRQNVVSCCETTNFLLTEALSFIPVDHRDLSACLFLSFIFVSISCATQLPPLLEQCRVMISNTKTLTRF